MRACGRRRRLAFRRRAGHRPAACRQRHGGRHGGAWRGKAAVMCCPRSCSASFMKWLKTDLYVADARTPGAAAERLTFWNEPGHPDFCDCGHALASDFSWNQQRSAAVVFVQFLNWPRYLPIPVGFDARYYILELDRLPERPDQSSKLTRR